MKMNPIPTTRKSNRYATSPVMAPLTPPGSAARRRRAAELSSNFARIRHELLPSGEARLQLVPEGNPGLAELPAQVDLAAVHPAGEVDQPGEVVLQFDAQALQLLLVLLHPFAVALQLVLDLLELFLVR